MTDSTRIPADVVINPTREQLVAAFVAANDNANPPRSRQRTCRLPESLIDDILTETEGLYEDDGGGVANSYGYRATTSRVGAVWYTAADGRKHVRVCGDRVSISGRHVSYLFGANCEPGWAAVYPTRAARANYLQFERAKKAIDRVGPAGDDDRLQIFHPLPVAVSEQGVLVADHATRPRVVQVVVRDTTTGQRHHITVPPKFATPTSKTYQKIVAKDGKRGLIHAAIAWTFNLTPAQYAPALEA